MMPRRWTWKKDGHTHWISVWVEGLRAAWIVERRHHNLFVIYFRFVGPKARHVGPRIEMGHAIRLGEAKRRAERAAEGLEHHEYRWDVQGREEPTP